MKSQRKPDAIMFDVYDTLFLNDTDAWQRAFQQIAEEQGLDITGADLWKRWKKHEVGFRVWRTNMDAPETSPPFKSYETAWRECFEKVFEEDNIPGNAANAARRSVTHMAHRDPFPETVKALSELSTRVPLGVFSNADDAFLRPMLDEYGLTSKFEVVESSESAAVYKPHPRAFKHMFAAMQVEPGKAWYVGDHLYDDIRGGSEVGATAIWINRNDAKPGPGDATPAHEITSLMDLVEMFDRSK
ncbi:MAG: HAD family hydrolase [Chloroflexi bacterium]|jgi:2-haloalkanoic acid dehalogenase type II|nr:HAD family hydrolase [Chloroflexota bacterium]MBT4074314.1 HAD family hydrolase [Chloroflexota bacterium]MBT4514320.1 HAD family hydrolase [Chloroflexota bacterium]MBT5318417.1 HAD family hydrolase [Chloroflexota bacterium]MBT6682728.1 HAD family hydrolase [Chloroflexota bacterium]